MSLLPGGDDLFQQMLLWLGLPIALIVVLMTGLTAIDWARRALTAIRLGRRAVASVGSLLVARTPKTRRILLRLVGSQGSLLAVSYALIRLVQITFSMNLDDGRLYDTSDVLMRAISFSFWTPLAAQTAWGVLAVLLTLNVGVWTRTPWLRDLAALPLYAIGVVCFVVGVVAVIPGLATLALGLGHSDGYTVGMAALNGIFVLLLLAWPAAASITLGAAADLTDQLAGASVPPG